MRSDQIKKGIERAPHRSLLKATGVTDAMMDKPFIAIVNSYIDIVPGHVHLQDFGKLVKEAVRAAGGVPFEFNTIGVDDGIAMGHIGMSYSLPSRELIADCVETMIEAHCFDGMVCIPNCDKIVPGMAMAAMRTNIPTIFVSGGPMAAGQDARWADRRSDLCFRRRLALTRRERSTLQRLKTLEDYACPGCGSCSGMFTANSMNCLLEVIGLALPYNGSALAKTPERESLARRAGALILELVEKQITARGRSSPRKRWTMPSPWIWRWAARPTPCCMPWRSPTKAGSTTRLQPHQRSRRPSRPHLQGQPIRTLAHGRRAPRRRDPGHLEGSRPHRRVRCTWTGSPSPGRPWRDLVSRRGNSEMRKSSTGWRTRTTPHGGLAILFGNLAPDGAVIKTGGVSPSMRKFSGTARIYEFAR